MRRLLRCTLPLLCLLLVACGDGIRERVFPPTASIQELAWQADGRWALKLRLQNFSNVPMHVTRVDATLRVANAEAGRVDLAPNLSVPPESVEVVELVLQPGSAAANHVQAAVARRGSVSYTLGGTITSDEPESRRDDFEFASQLSVVPGLERVLR